MPSKLTLMGSVLERSLEAGLYVSGSDATIDASWVRDTKGSAFDDRFGDGIVVISTFGPATAIVTASGIEASARVGISAVGAPVGIETSRLECNLFHLAGEVYGGAPFSIDDLGGNTCGCMGAPVTCQIDSPGLQPPEPISP